MIDKGVALCFNVRVLGETPRQQEDEMARVQFDQNEKRWKVVDDEDQRFEPRFFDSAEEAEDFVDFIRSMGE